MPDTGAPWNIPYADPTDLVRDWPALSEDVADAVALGLTSAKQIVAVKFAIKTDTQTTSGTVATPFAITGLTISHAAAAATNIIYCIASTNVVRNGNGGGVSLTAGGTEFSIAASPGSRNAVGQVGGAGSTTYMTGQTVIGQRTAGVTSAITYGVSVTPDTSATFYVNRSDTDTNNNGFYRGASTLLLFEVAA